MRERRSWAEIKKTVKSVTNKKVISNEKTKQTSSFKMKLAKTMNSENEEELPSEFCFFDGKVKRTKGFTTLTASCFTKTSAVSGNGVYKRG